MRTSTGRAIGPLLAVAVAVAVAGTAAAGGGARPGSPLDATYGIADAPVALVDGTANVPAAPGSATRITTRVVGAPVLGDLDGDGDDDAVLWLVQDPGGSGTFHYVAAAFNEGGAFRGTNAVWLGDRIAPRALTVAHRVVTAAFGERPAGRPMADPPTMGTARHFTAAADGLVPVAVPAAGDSLFHGWLTIGHEVRSFRPCAGEEPLWLVGDPGSLAAVSLAYRTALPGAAPYAPLFATVVGRLVAAPDRGFGATYAGGFAVSALVDAWPAGNCLSDQVVERNNPSDKRALDASIEVPLRLR